MARPVEPIAQTLEEALRVLKHDPSLPVHAHIDDLDVELRVVSKPKQPLGDFMADGRGWKGKSPEEILRLLRETSATGGSSEPPKAMRWLLDTNTIIHALNGVPSVRRRLNEMEG